MPICGKRARMKKQKSTYTARRETQKLRAEAQRLAAELAALQIRALSPEEAAQLDPVVKQTTAKNAVLTSVAKTEQLRVATAQSMLSRCVGDGQQSHPLYSRICLTKDWDERRATLMAVREEKLRNAFDFVMAPGRFVDPEKAHTSDQRFETAQGDVCSVHLEAVHFPGVQSLQQVWEALMFYYSNIEISISERLGDITVRDDYDSIEGSVYNTRVLSRNENCTAIESSIVTFPQFFNEDDIGFGGKACGIMAIDSIDEDELYPYFPSERVRLDTSGAIVLTANIRKPKGSSEKPSGLLVEGLEVPDAEGELVVTLRRAAFLKLYHPQFPVSESTRQDLQAGIGRWGDVMIKTIRSIVYSSP
ncbi:hypothetical protein BBJ28_00018513 [Nothophytophthora sp. Chile5]|nr:hypothetical protein BBJ28_00018513 [Nothophytophthora sp. Chile5]